MAPIAAAASIAAAKAAQAIAVLEEQRKRSG
jgi:hypothetical protein